MNSQFFDYNKCDFSEKSMYSRHPNDTFGKEGSLRVCFYK